MRIKRIASDLEMKGKEQMKKNNSKSKLEQIFIMMVLFIGCLGIFTFTGCGGRKSCETIKCNAVNGDGKVGAGVSVPGCGGCLSSGKGCNSCLWAQSYKCAAGSDSMEVGSEEETSTASTRVIGCDARYYGAGCVGCGQKEKSSYIGCINRQYPADKTSGCFYGSSDKEEKLIGCSNGSGGCAGSNGTGKAELDLMEGEIGIE